MNDKEGDEQRLPPAVEEAMAKLVELFSDPRLPSKAQLRCAVEGPDDLDVLFESILDDQFGHDPNSEYKQWVRRPLRARLHSSIARRMEIEPPISLATVESRGRL
jgi:hypothetical protein